MSSIARKLARKTMKAAEQKTAVATRARRSVQHATTEQIIRDHSVVSEAYDNLMVLFDVAVHRAFGWGKKMRTRLHAKMAVHLLCLRGRMVTTGDIEKILRDEAGLDLDKCHMQADKWDTQKLAVHPTQKPVALFEYLIKTYTNPGELVLDNCMGSGTTAIACMNTERDFIGFEVDKGYYDTACKRIEGHKDKVEDGNEQ